MLYMISLMSSKITILIEVLAGMLRAMHIVLADLGQLPERTSICRWPWTLFYPPVRTLLGWWTLVLASSSETDTGQLASSHRGAERTGNDVPLLLEWIQKRQDAQHT